MRETQSTFPLNVLGGPLDIAIVGTGIAGMSAAWLLSKRHRVTVYEKQNRLGGHSNTVEIDGPNGPIPVDTGFIVYNETNYPNLVALFDHLKVATRPSQMSFSASIGDGRIEYAGTNLMTLFAQKRNIVSLRHWQMLRDIFRFYRAAPSVMQRDDIEDISLGDLLLEGGYSKTFAYDHLLPMGAAIWSTEVEQFRHYSAAAFIRFFESHGLLKLHARPKWRTVEGGSREYIKKLTADYAVRIQLGRGAKKILRFADHVIIEDDHGDQHRHDHVVIATHADEAYRLLQDPSADEASIFSNFRYQTNLAVLHRDPRLMPRRKAVWSSWNYLRGTGANMNQVCVTYWMNKLQGIDRDVSAFVTLNPYQPLDDKLVWRTIEYEHPIFDMESMRAQRKLWPLQGRNRTWFCGSYFGSGFHEDALQSGLAVAESLGGVKRPWSVTGESDRIFIPASPEPLLDQVTDTSSELAA